MGQMNELVPSASIRTFLLIENRLLREALVRLFSKRADLLVVGQTGYADATVLAVLDSRCDVLVIDSLQTPWFAALTGIENADRASFKTVVIARETDEEHFLAAVRASVTGYLLQDASASDVVAAVRAVYRGEAVCPPSFARHSSASSLKRLRRSPFQQRHRSPILLCASNSWSRSSRRGLQIRKSLHA